MFSNLLAKPQRKKILLQSCQKSFSKQIQTDRCSSQKTPNFFLKNMDGMHSSSINSSIKDPMLIIDTI